MSVDCPIAPGDNKECEGELCTFERICPHSIRAMDAQHPCQGCPHNNHQEMDDGEVAERGALQEIQQMEEQEGAQTDADEEAGEQIMQDDIEQRR